MAAKTKKTRKHLEQYEREMNMCIRCAYCFEKCPVIKEVQWDTDGARGKVIMSYGLLTGELEPSQYIADKLFRCTFCRDCLDRCPSKVNILHIIASARAEIVEAGFASDTHKYIIENIKKTGNIYGDTEVISQEQEGKIPLFIGCQYLGRPNKTKKYLKILEKLDIKPAVVKEICCGFPMEVLGFKDDYEKHKDNFKKHFPFKEAITLCPTCTVFLKEGHEIKAKHVLQIILEKLPKANLNMKVTYHDPCDFSRGLKIIEEPRKILEKLGVEIVEMKNNKENSRCCGGGGGILMTDQELSNDIAKKRIHEALETGVDTLVTSCPTCETTLKKAAQEIAESEGKTISVRSIEDIIWKGLQDAERS
ncbi:MAG: (Fe-S)-binding protein [Candidatus Thermoplasmatota archaeon]|nr:(Fe-S)-binding protein [Candidatus Thermoplasmatota archaeon]